MALRRKKNVKKNAENKGLVVNFAHQPCQPRIRVRKEKDADLSKINATILVSPFLKRKVKIKTMTLRALGDVVVNHAMTYLTIPTARKDYTAMPLLDLVVELATEDLRRSPNKENPEKEISSQSQQKSQRLENNVLENIRNALGTTATQVDATKDVLLVGAQRRGATRIPQRKKINCVFSKMVIAKKVLGVLNKTMVVTMALEDVAK